MSADAPAIGAIRGGNVMDTNDSTITVEIFDGRKPDSIIAEAELEGE